MASPPARTRTRTQESPPNSMPVSEPMTSRGYFTSVCRNSTCLRPRSPDPHGKMRHAPSGLTCRTSPPARSRGICSRPRASCSSRWSFRRSISSSICTGSGGWARKRSPRSASPATSRSSCSPSRRCSASAPRRWCRMRPERRTATGPCCSSISRRCSRWCAGPAFLLVMMTLRGPLHAGAGGRRHHGHARGRLPALVHSGDVAAVRDGRDGLGAARHRQLQAGNDRADGDGRS